MRDDEKINNYQFFDFVKNVCCICNITKTNNRVCNVFRNNQFIEMFEFSTFHIRNRIYSNEKKSLQCFIVSSQSSIQNDVEIDVQKHFIVNSLFLIDTIKSTCKIAKKSTIASIAKFSKSISKKKTKSRIRIVYLFAKLKTSRLDFSLNTFVTISKTMKNSSIQKIVRIRAKCKQCEQNFDFNKKFFEHISEHKVLKFVKNSSFTIFTLKSLCEFERKSIDICSFFSFESLIFTTSKNLTSNTKTFLQFVSSKYSNFQLRVFNFASKSTKNASISRIVDVRTICKRCKQNFNFNNKFHEYIREHHVRKSVQSLNFKIFASKLTCKIKKKSIFICSFVSFVSQKSFIFFATSRNQIFSTKIISQFLLSKCSNFSIATHKISSKLKKKLSISCSFIFSLSSSRILVRNHQKFHIQNFYLIMNDLQQHYNRRFFSQSFDVRQFRFAFSKRFHLIIENLFEMFDKKFRKTNLFQSRNNVFFLNIFKSNANHRLF